MTITKTKLIEFLNNRFPEDTIFKLSIELSAPPEDNSLIGTTFGSAQHMIRSASKKMFSEDIHLSYKYLA